MTQDQLAELYRDSWHRRDQITSEVDMPCTLLTVLAGAIVYLFTTFSFHNVWVAWAFGLFLAPPILFGALATLNVARAYHGYEYAAIPTGKELLAYRETLRSHYSGRDDAAALVDVAFDDYLSEVLAVSEEINSDNNTSRAAFLHGARRWLIRAIVAATLTTVPWLIDRASGTQAAPTAAGHSPQETSK